MSADPAKIIIKIPMVWKAKENRKNLVYLKLAPASKRIPNSSGKGDAKKRAAT